MAVFHARLTHGGKGQAENRYDYIMRQNQFNSPDKSKEVVETKDINIPSWAKTGKEFFQAADIYERSNGNTFKQLIIALPCELSNEENIRIANDIAQRILGNNKAGAFAVHTKKASLSNVDNIHLHLIFNERIIKDISNVKPAYLFFKRCSDNMPEEKRGYKKDIRFSMIGKYANQNIKWLRNEIEEAINSGYERVGSQIRVSCKTLIEQKEEALKNNNINKAEFLNRKPLGTLNIKQWQTFKKILKDYNIIDYQQPIPIMPTEKNISAFNEIMEKDYFAFEKLFEHLEFQSKKLRYQINEAIKEQEEIEKQFHQDNPMVKGSELFKMLSGISARTKLKIQQNTKLIALYQKIYGNQQLTSNFITNVVTRKRANRYITAKNNLKNVQAQYDYLVSNNKMTDNLQKRYDWNLSVEKQKVEKLEKEIQEINNSTIAEKRYQHVVDRLKKAASKYTKHRNDTALENSQLMVIDSELEKIAKEINLNPKISIRLKLLKEIQKNIVEQPKAAKEKLIELRKKIQKINEKQITNKKEIEYER